MAPKKAKTNYGALFNAGAALQSGAFPKAAAESLSRLAEEDLTSVQLLPLEVLLSNPYQPRETMDEEALQQLAQTIQSQGFQGVLIARPHPTQGENYQITAGHRRRDAAKRAGLTSLPVVIKEISDQDMAILAVTENIQREDLTPLEEGRIFSTMMETMGMTLEQVAEAVGKSESYVRNRRRVAQAPEDIQQMVVRKPDSLRAVFYLLKVEDISVRASLIEMIVQGQLIADQVDQYVKTLEQQRSPQQRIEIATQPDRDTETSIGEVSSAATSSPGVKPSQTTRHATTPVSKKVATQEPDYSQRQTPPPTVSEVLPETVAPQKQTLVGVSKLKTLLKTIQAYAQTVTTQQKLSPEEIDLLDQIIEVAQQARHDFSPESEKG
jgi:ParB/RepB/Spo0J family partition protein